MKQSVRIFLVVLAGVALVHVGCAKRPALGSAAPAPAPTGAATGAPATATPAPAPEPPRIAEPTPAPAPTPAPPAAVERPAPQEFTAVAAVRDIHFDFDRADIRAADARVLDANATWLQENRQHLVLIEGHCDERGTNEYNLALGERRAREARNYLVSKGIAADRISIVSYGEERPQCSEHTEGCWAQNRRAHFLVKAR